MSELPKLILAVCLIALCIQARGADCPFPFVRGVDASFLRQIEDHGGAYYDGGLKRDALAIFRNHGVNLLRLRVWNNPADGYSGKADVLGLASRGHALGMRLLIDFHYSDTWADPAHQTKPAAWATLSDDALRTAVHDFTKDIVSSLAAQGTPPDFVQVGNEIRAGMLWPTGYVSGGTDPNWPRFASLLKAGVAGVKDGMPAGRSTSIVLHIDSGGNNAWCRDWYDAAVRNAVPFDTIGLSYYPWWHGTPQALAANLGDLAQRYGKPVMVVEAAYPWTLANQDATNNIVGLPSQLSTGYPATPAGQRAFLDAVFSIVRAVPGGKGAGVVYWEPDWISTASFGSAWENLATFDFGGNVLTSIDAFSDPVGDVKQALRVAGGLCPSTPDSAGNLVEATALLRRALGL
ncbi:MAG TPA: arabinogalactan endo-1,4-beta-galactosidase [Armatimonadota bacterium]|jgi:arabinogalactan endo-1,4-beta-galactosidase